MSRDKGASRRESRKKTDKGTVHVSGPALPEEIRLCVMDGNLRSFRMPHKQKEALVEIAGLEEGQVFLACSGQTIIGYVTFHPPEKFERWGQTDIDCILELGAIEVSSYFRGVGIGRLLMEIAFRDGALDDYIVIATEYYWHWDLEGIEIPIWEYRKILESVMKSVGMRPKETNDPEICSHPANVLMVRVGENVGREDREAFEELCRKEDDDMDIFVD